MSLTATIRGGRELRDLLQRLGPKLTKAVATATIRVALAVEKGAKHRVPKNFNRLGTAIRTEFNEDKTVADVGVFEGTTKHGVPINYAVYVEEGTGPRSKPPPIKPLKLWAKRKLHNEGAAYSIQRKIQREGTPAQPYLEPALEKEAGPKYTNELHKEIGKAIL